MVIKELSRRLLPPIAIDAGKWLLRYGAQQPLCSGTRVRIPYGRFFLECDSTHHLPKILQLFPNFGCNLADVVTALQAKAPRVIDVGANIGDTALLLARFAPDTQVLCIEGDARFMPDLRSNTAQIEGVTVAQAIVSDRSAQVKGAFVTNNGTAHFVQGEGGDLLQTQTLDDLVQAYPEFAFPIVIKIDTDGYETAVLRGAKGVLASARPVVFYEWHPDYYRVAGEDDTSHADLLMELGYDCFIFFTNAGEPLLSIRKPDHSVLESLARFSRGRRQLDDWHYDIAAFPAERSVAWERLARHRSKPDLSLALSFAVIDGAVQQLLFSC
jgi:FkbM family methyltransferase